VLAEDSANVDCRLRLAATTNKVGLLSNRSRDIPAAVSAYQKAVELAAPEVAAKSPNEEALYSTADSFAGLAQAEMILASVHRQTIQNKMSHWDQARQWCERSIGIWDRIKEPGKASPGGFECTPKFEVAQRLARCKEALVHLETGRNPHS
jgi:hypothetical protein